MSKVDDNKLQKRNSLLESAFSLFIQNGFAKTSISNIVDEARVAKGTFYLYFKDKYDIRNHLITYKANQVFQNAYQFMLTHPEVAEFEDRLLLLTDHILNQLNNNHNLVRLISKNLSWGFFKNFLYTPPDSEHPSIYSIYEKLLSDAKDSYRDPDMMMYLILELVSGSSYNAILFQEPVPLAELKPLLYETIRGILRQHKEKPAEK